jgi:hypothetical protein
MINIEYARGTRQSVIESVTFDLDDEKQLILSPLNIFDDEDSERVVKQALSFVVRDNSFGDEEISLELNICDGTDLARNLQRLLRQIGSFQPEILEEE